MAEEFPAVSKGLFLEGQPGVGKTHLAVAVLKQVIQTSGARGIFYDTRDLLRVIRSTYDPSTRTTELDVLRPVMTATCWCWTIWAPRRPPNGSKRR